MMFLAVVLLATACEGPPGPPGPMGPAGTVYKAYNGNLEIQGKDWVRGNDDFGPHYYADLIIPELDAEMIDGDGLYQLTWRYRENGFEIRQTLETTVYHKEPNGTLWSENISCQFSVGEARIIIRYSDFNMDRTPPDIMQFLFAAMW